jgi:hypothetical protein
MRHTIMPLVVAAVMVLILAFAGPVLAAGGGEGQGTAECAVTKKDVTARECPIPEPAPHERRSF